MSGLTVWSLWDAAERRNPGATAIRWPGGMWTHAQLRAAAEGLAAASTTELGVEPGDRVALLMRNGPDYLASVLACALAGFVVVPINTSLTHVEASVILGDSGARAMLTEERLYGTALAAMRRCGGPTKRILVVDQEYLPTSPRALPPPPDADDLFYLGYTSGTTGKPKGARITHRNRTTAILLEALEFGITGGDSHLAVSPLYHTAPLTFALLHLCLGGSVRVRPTFEAPRAAEELEHTDVTTTFMAPATLRRILEVPPMQQSESKLRALIVGGAPFPRETKMRALNRFGSVLHEFYGATEVGIVTNLPPDEQTSKSTSVGRLFPGAQVQIRAADSAAVLPAKQAGEVWVSSATMYAGYQRGETPARDWIFLGDIGFLDDDGYLHLVDRVSDIVISGGVNIYTREVERALEEHPAVADVAVVGVPDDTWGERAVAVVCLAEGMAADAEFLAAFCAGRLAPHKRPKQYVFRTELPRSDAGKVLKRALRDAVATTEEPSRG